MRMPYDEPADLIGSCEATLDTLGLLLGDMSEEVRSLRRAWTIAQILNHLLDTERRYYGRVRRMRRRDGARRCASCPTPTTRSSSALRAWTLFYELRRRHLQAAALAEARRVAPVRHARPPLGDITDRVARAAHGRPRRHAHGADRAAAERPARASEDQQQGASASRIGHRQHHERKLEQRVADHQQRRPARASAPAAQDQPAGDDQHRKSWKPTYGVKSSEPTMPAAIGTADARVPRCRQAASNAPPATTTWTTYSCGPEAERAGDRVAPRDLPLGRCVSASTSR